MSLETTLANIVIKNNTIDQGKFSDGISPVSYNYTYHMWVFGSATIDGNAFVGPSISSDMLNIDNCSCIITNNKFIRGSVSINSYIRNYGSNEQSITNNIFDQPTTDGTTETLVLNLTDTSIYERNKNQTNTIMVMMEDQNTTTSPWFWDTSTNYDHHILGRASSPPSSGAAYLIQGGLVSNSANVGPLRNVAYFVNLSRVLPKNVHVMSALIGFKYDQLQSNIDQTTTSTLLLRLSKTLATKPLTNPFSSPTSTMANIAAVFSEGNLENSADVSTTITNGNYNTTNYYSLTNDYSTSYINNHITDLIMIFRYNFATTANAGTSSYILSPLLVKYRWV